MAQVVRCPACNSQVDLSGTACPICLRPISRQEIVRALQAGKKHDRNVRRGILGLVAVVAFGAAFAALPGFRRPLLTVLSPVVFIGRVATGHVARSIKADWPDFTPQEETQAPPPQATPAAAPQPAPAPQAPAPTAPPATPVSAPSEQHATIVLPPKAPTWTLAGLVYRLRDAKPAAGVELLFASTANDLARKTRTGKDGRYTIALPALSSAAGQGYQISIVSRGRKLSYLEEAALPYRERTPAQREDAIEEARQSPVLHAPLSPESEQTTQDFAILP